jgi:Tol biopolymer transport system component
VTLPEPLGVRTLDSFDNPVAGAAVTFVVVDGGGAIAADTVFTDSLGNATSQLWTLGPTAGKQRVRAQSGNAWFVFSADACDPVLCSRLAYVSGNAIFTLDEHTELVHQLTSGDRDLRPSWSPDGRRIAFGRFSRDWTSADVWVMNADGTGQARVTSGNVFHSPSWSPRGDALAFAGDGSMCVYECALYVQQLAEGSVPRLVAPMAADPAWSPDGSRIAFVALSGDDGYHSLRLVEPDGSGIVEVTPIDEGGIYGPSWSPDGTRIAFSKCTVGGCDIHTVHADGSDLTRLTDVGTASSPAWSADGTRIAFTIWAEEVSSIALVSAAGGAVTTLIASAHSPAWRP